MIPCLFASDLHGNVDRYNKLFDAIRAKAPRAVFLGGDLCPSGLARWDGPESAGGDFLNGFLFSGLQRLRLEMGSEYPEILAIPGNDDMRTEEHVMIEAQEAGLWQYIHNRKTAVDGYPVFGYAFVPPTPFPWKDWERYDVSRYIPPGSVSPEEGWRTVEADRHWVRYGTIKTDLEDLTSREEDLSRSVFLFHTPPHETSLDRADLDGKSVDHVPLDIHVGSIAVRRFIQARQPRLTLHGHIHESARLTGSWQDRIGDTLLFTAAHDGPELALVRFDLDNPSVAERLLL